jgi:hypothetical protein
VGRRRQDGNDGGERVDQVEEGCRKQGRMRRRKRGRGGEREGHGEEGTC